MLKTLGINNNYNTKNRNEHDYYASPPESVDWLLKYENFTPTIWECMCGGGAISERLKQHGYNVVSSDLYDYGYPDTIIKDFLKCTEPSEHDIISNPPYKLSIEMTLQAIKLCKNKVAFLMKIQFLETIKRHKKIFKEYPPARIYIFVKRVSCGKNGIYDSDGSAVCYCWVVWDKNYDGDTTFHWIPNYNG